MTRCKLALTSHQRSYSSVQRTGLNLKVRVRYVMGIHSCSWHTSSGERGIPPVSERLLPLFVPSSPALMSQTPPHVWANYAHSARAAWSRTLNSNSPQRLLLQASHTVASHAPSLRWSPQSSRFISFLEPFRLTYGDIQRMARARIQAGYILHCSFPIRCCCHL